MNTRLGGGPFHSRPRTHLSPLTPYLSRGNSTCHAEPPPVTLNVVKGLKSFGQGDVGDSKKFRFFATLRITLLENEKALELGGSAPAIPLPFAPLG